MTNALRVPAYRRMWAAGVISDTGDWLLFIAMPLVVYDMTGSAMGTSLAFLMELLPAVLVSPLAARLVARFDRRRLMMVVGAGQALVLVPLLLVGDDLQLPLVFAVIVMHTSLGAIFEPAKATLLPDVVGRDALVSANGLANLGGNLARLGGGPLGGILLVVGGLELVVIVDIATYVIAIACIASMRVEARAVTQRDAAPGGILEALRSPGLRSTFAIVLVTSISQGLFLVLFVLFVLERLGGDEGDVGLLRGVQAIGAIAAALVLGFLTRAMDARRMAVVSAAAFGLVSLVTWNLAFATTWMPWFVLLFVIVGAPGVTLMTGLATTLQRDARSGLLGGAFAAVGMLSAIGQGMGILLAGLAVTPVALTVLLETQGVVYLVAAAIGALAMRSGARVALR